jgi:hypothetical protein
MRTVTILAGLLLALSTLGCGQAAASVAPTRYPAMVRETFLKYCEVDGTPEACVCLLEYLEQRMSYDEFVRLDAAGTAVIQADARLQAGVAACIN